MTKRIDSGTEQLRVELDTTGVLRIVLHNPATHNSLTADMLNGLRRLFADASNDPAVRVILLRGSGDAAFASGADIGEQAQRSAVGTINPDRGGFVSDLLGCAKPVVAMIHGWCLGGGLLVAMTADIRIAADDARFSVPATRLGVAYPLEAAELLVDLVGRGAASSILLVGDRFDAETAQRLGLVTEVVTKELLEARVEAVAATLAANAPLSVAAAKASITHACTPRTDTRAAVEAAIDAVWASEDAAEGMEAFLAKRDPLFKGR